MTNFGEVFIVDRVVCGKSDGNIKDADGQVWVPQFEIKLKAHLSAEEIAKVKCLYLTQFLTDIGQILDYKSYDQA